MFTLVVPVIHIPAVVFQYLFPLRLFAIVFDEVCYLHHLCKDQTVGLLYSERLQRIFSEFFLGKLKPRFTPAFDLYPQIHLELFFGNIGKIQFELDASIKLICLETKSSVISTILFKRRDGFVESLVFGPRNSPTLFNTKAKNDVEHNIEKRTIVFFSKF